MAAALGTHSAGRNGKTGTDTPTTGCTKAIGTSADRAALWVTAAQDEELPCYTTKVNL